MTKGISPYRILRFCLLLASTLLLGAAAYPQDTLRIHFYYGSKPAKLFKDQEKKHFGGIHGGHVSIETEDGVYGFGPQGKFHLVARRRAKKRHSYFQYQTMEEFRTDSAGKQYLTIFIPVSSDQAGCVDSLHQAYRQDVPYDYAFIGMRCTAATSEILSQIHLLRKRWKGGRYRYFFPRKLRNKLTKMARKNNWRMIYREGNLRRHWERDLKKTRRTISQGAEFMPASR